MDSYEELAAQLHARVKNNLGRVKSATCPVYVGSGAIPKHIGSGVLFRIEQHSFLLTAAHVTDYRSSGHLYLGSEATPVRIAGSVTHSTPPAGQRGADNIDVAVCHLAPETVAHLGDHEFLTVSELDVESRERHDDFFLVVGYPCTKQRFLAATQTIEAYLYPFVAVSKPSSAYEAQSLDFRRHILLGFSKKEMWRRDIGHATAPDLYGISGCGIWWLENHLSPEPSAPRLAALATEWHTGSRRQIMGTRVEVALSAVWKNFPEVRASLP